MLHAQPRSKIESIQVFRGLAALAVIFYHVQLIGRQRLGVSFGGQWFYEGRAGVDFFFVLSGFIMTYVDTDDVGHPGRVRDYATKRFIRIYPLLLVLTLAKLLAMLIWPTLVGEHELSLSLIVNSLFMLPQDRVPILPLAWTLSHRAKLNNSSTKICHSSSNFLQVSKIDVTLYLIRFSVR